MTAFTTAMLPTGQYAITHIDELIDWANAIQCFNNPTDTEIEALNTNRINRFMRPELRIPSGELIRVCRSMVGINEAAALNLPSWKRVNEYSTNNIPAAYKIGA